MESKLLDKKKFDSFLDSIKLSEDYNHRILLYYNNFFFKNKIFNDFDYKSINLRGKLKISEVEKKIFCLEVGKNISGFTFFEFAAFLLQKLGLNFKNKIFNKILRLKKFLSFLKFLKYFKFKSFRIRVNYNFLLYFLIALLKGIIFSVLCNSNKSMYAKRNKVRTKVYYLIYNYIGYKFFFKDLKIVIP